MAKWTDILPSLFGGKELLTEIKEFANEFIHTTDERKQFEIGLMKLGMDKSEMYLADVESARKMYQQDNQLQKWVAITLIGSWLLLTLLMLIGGYLIAVNEVEFPAWFISLISAIWGAFTAKVNTIVDFLFGSSEGSKAKDRAFETQIAKIQQQATGKIKDLEQEKLKNTG